MNFRLNELMGCLTSELETLTDPGVSVEISFRCSDIETCVYHTWYEIRLILN